MVAIASRDPERAKQMADGFDGARAADSYDALLADPEVDAVYIPLVNSDHKPWTLRALEAGKHVLCEKPLAMNAAEAEEMAAAAKRSGKHLMEAAMYRFHPRTRAFVESLTEPIYVQASFGFKLKNKTDYRLEAAMGGGALLDVGFYIVSVARWILGEPSEVLARSRLRDGTDVTTSALLQFPGGETAARSPSAAAISVASSRAIACISAARRSATSRGALLSTTELGRPADRWRVDFLLGAWQMLPLLISVIPFGLILGALSADKGMSLLELTLMSGLVFAGSAQFVAAGLWQHPLPVLAIVASTALINSRHLLMGALDSICASSAASRAMSRSSSSPMRSGRRRCAGRPRGR